MITYYTKEGEFKVTDIVYIPWQKLHRLDGPAVIYSSGVKKWFKEGKCHRLDGPAITDCFGKKEWYINGRKHRLDGPAIIDLFGDKKWWVNGKLHRLDGPAIEYFDGRKEWYVNDKKLNTKKVETWIKSNNINLKTKQHQVLFMVMFG